MELTLKLLALTPIDQVFGKESIVPCAVLLMVVLIVPVLFERLRLPGLLGLVGAGVVLSPAGWNLFDAHSIIINLLSDIGLVYLMFVTGLEVDIKLFQHQQKRSLGFASLSFIVSIITGIFISKIFGFAGNTSILISSLFVSHTFLAYPIIRHLGIFDNVAISATMGARVFTDIAALLILSMCLNITNIGEVSLVQIITKLVWLIIYFFVFLVSSNWAGKEFLQRAGDDEGNKFIFVLLTIFLGILSADFIGTEKITGAFLAGLAVNQTIGSGLVKEKIVFIGSILFIPIFFVYLGLLINFPTLINTFANLNLLLIIIFGLLISKLITALLTKFIYGYKWQEVIIIWSISVPQLATILAIALVGFRSGLLSIEVLNSVIILTLITTIFGQIITNRVAVNLTDLPSADMRTIALSEPNIIAIKNNFTIVVPVYNPQTQEYLIELAAYLARQVNGKIVPLAIATATAQMDAPQLTTSIHKSEQLLAKAKLQSRELDIIAEPLLRIDHASASGISRAAREQKANLIVMGWSQRTGLRARLFGNVVDSVVWSSHCPVAVTRLVESPKKIQRILVPVENLIAPVLQPVQFAQMLAEAIPAQVTVLNVCDRQTSSSKLTAKRSRLSLLVSRLALANPPEIQIIAHENVAQAILQAARLYDLVVLPFTHHSTRTGGLDFCDVTTQLAKQLTCSIIILGTTQHSQTMVISTGVANVTRVI